MSGTVLKIPTLKGLALEFGKMIWRPYVYYANAGAAVTLDLSAEEHEDTSVIVIRQPSNDDDVTLVLPLPGPLVSSVYVVFAPDASGSRTINLRQGNETDGIGTGGTDNTDKSRINRALTILLSLDGNWVPIFAGGGTLVDG